jgi:hypothetical protein
VPVQIQVSNNSPIYQLSFDFSTSSPSSPFISGEYVGRRGKEKEGKREEKERHGK